MEQTYPSPARNVFEKIVRSDEFLRGSHNSVRLGGVALTAGNLSEQLREKNQGYPTPESMQLELISVLPEYLRAQHEFDINRDSMSRNEKRTALESIIPLNHVPRDIIDNELYTRVSDITRFVSEILLKTGCSREIISYARSSVEGVLNGMRHEIASESVLSSLPGVEIVEMPEGTDEVEEEMRGRDILIKYMGQVIALDIKASEQSASSANAESNHRGYNAVWSGFTNDDFGGMLIPTRKMLVAKKIYFRNVINRIVGRDAGIAV